MLLKFSLLSYQVLADALAADVTNAGGLAKVATPRPTWLLLPHVTQGLSLECLRPRVPWCCDACKTVSRAEIYSSKCSLNVCLCPATCCAYPRPKAKLAVCAQV